MLGWPAMRSRVVSLLSVPTTRARAAAGPSLVPFSHLAASQIGYAPAGPKAFTSPTRFEGFRLVDDASGRTVWQGGPPARMLPTGLLGPIRDVWIGDFSPVVARGRYRLLADNGLTSHPFSIDIEVHAPAIRAAQRVFYFQRAFTAIEPRFSEGPWWHPTDAALAPAGVRRGWHDAGDYSLYNMTAVSSLFWLLEAYSDFAPRDDDTNIPESGNGVPDLLDEGRWELEWLLSVATPDGGVRNSTCLEHYDAYGSNAPDTRRPYVHGEPGTIATARAVGILAYAAHVFSTVDPAFATTLGDAARRGWRYLEQRPGEHSDGPTCAAYRQHDDRRAGRATRMFAAAGMLTLTGEARFRDAFEAVFDDIEGDPSPYRFNAYASLLYLRAPAGDPRRQAAIRARLLALADEAVTDSRAHPFGWAGRYIWGSTAVAFERAGAFTVKQCLTDAQPASPYCQQALANLDYVLGRNSYQFAYVSGLPGVSRGRTHAFHHWLATMRATPFLFPGAVAGGPNETPEPNDGSRPLGRPRPTWGYWGDPAMPRDAATPIDGRYTDNDSWSTNELAITWQAAALYNLYFARWAAGALGAGGGEVAADVIEDAGGGVAVAVGIPR